MPDDYHMAYLSDDIDDPLYADMAVHDGSPDNCTRCDGRVEYPSE